MQNHHVLLELEHSKELSEGALQSKSGCSDRIGYGCSFRHQHLFTVKDLPPGHSDGGGGALLNL